MRRLPFFAATTLLLAALPTLAAAAPPPPRSAHPRLFLAPTVLAAMKAKVSDPNSAASSAIARCQAVGNKPARAANGDEWTWSFGAASCALAYQLTGDPTAAATGLTLFSALLDDYTTVGDGAGGDAVVQHDDGYYIRIFGPYAALAYDWLATAPGMTQTLQAHAQARFKAWVDWYATSGYLPTTAAANYNAGYVFAKTLIAVAAAGEDHGVSDAYWADVVDNLFAKVIVGQGLAPASSSTGAGPLVGGDQPEGWQYGPLTVLEYALSARALEEQGAPQPDLRQWSSDLFLAYAYATPPAMDGVFTNGDLDNDAPLAALQARPLLATISWGGDDTTAGFAQGFRQINTIPADDCPVFEALAEARGATSADYTKSKPSLWYLAPGTRKLFARAAWTATSPWTVFTAAPRLVPDHQHPDAANFAFSVGKDHLVVDPSPYGGLSTLTANGINIDSNSVDMKAQPGQSIWQNASALPWARGVQSGIAAARADLSGAFDGDDGAPSDVPYAHREFAFLPEGDVVLIDRARTDDPSRAMHVRFRTPATLTVGTTAPFVSSATVGGTSLVIQAAKLSGGTPAARSLPDGGDCDSTPTWGVCDASRIAVNEYFVNVPGGGEMLAVHALSGVPSGGANPTVRSIDDPAVDSTPPANGGVVGASVVRGSTTTYVVGSSAKDGAAGTTLTYGVPGGGSSRHVVFDAPENAGGASTVTTAVSNGRCTITITAAGASGGFAGQPLVFSIGSATSGCTATEDTSAPPASATPGGVSMGGGGSSAGQIAPPGSKSSGGCNTSGSGGAFGGAALLGVIAAALSRARRKRRY